MEAKELRIGNLVDCGIVSEIFEVRTNYVRLKYFRKDVEKQHISLVPLDDRVKSIPLTEEWLLNFGFEWEDVESKTNGETDKMLFKDILLMKRHHDTLWVACPYGYLISPHRTIYVHQLQNLYFALTGEELTIKNQD